MDNRLLTALALTAGLLLDPSAFAQDDPAAEETTQEDSDAPEVRYKAKTEIDFGDRRVDGTIRRPIGSYTSAMRDQQFNPLVELRKNFDKEIVESVYSVR